MRDRIVAILGNPNSGKTTLFNAFTGLNQKVGNFPGVTVEKKIGELTLDKTGKVTVIDFPGAYSLFPTSTDEKVVVSNLLNKASNTYPDVVVYVADCNHLERHMLL
ncbi:MAG: 50S ribosome-binding GTPase, partial [Gammaproteobacteria bacterium]|nr:50S ribosome-binding GTPase [Gammaproteobacteria bacterium]